jgi:hypothetical protein
MGAVILKRRPITLDPGYSYRAINHVLQTGQSLALGQYGTPVTSTTQPYANLMFNAGVICGGTGITSFVPLVESGVETMAASMTALVTKISREQLLTGQPDGQQSHDMLASNHGAGGTPYAGLKKGGIGFYENGILQVQAAKSIAQGLGKSYFVRCVTNIHGESDCIAGSTTYRDNMLEWQHDYETDVKAITGQTLPIPMFHSQVSSFPALGQPSSTLPLQQLQASIDSGGKLVMVCPKYMVPYYDGAHLTAVGYQMVGEYYAKAYRRVILEGLPWEPLRPIEVTRDGATITVRFLVPVRPLVLDTELVTNPGSYGFRYMDDSGAPPAITNVATTSDTTVRITLASTPTGSNKRIRYGYTATSSVPSGPVTGARGCLRDSDPTVSRYGYPLYNWCVHFDEAVP